MYTIVPLKIQNYITPFAFSLGRKRKLYTHYKLGCLSTWPNFFLLISKSSILDVKIIPKHELSIKTHNIWRNNVASHTHTTRPHSKHSWLGAVPRFYIHTHTLTMYQLILLWKSRAPPKHTHTTRDTVIQAVWERRRDWREGNKRERAVAIKSGIRERQRKWER